MNRRSFLAATALGAGGLLLAPDALATPRFDAFEHVKLGRSGLDVSRFCLGTGMRGGGRESNHTRMGQEAFTSQVRGVMERGGNFFDLADLYGTHTYFREAVKGVPRDRYAITSKIWFRSGGIPEAERPDANVVVDRFLNEIGTDYIDLLLMHCVVAPNWPNELRRQMDLLAAMKENGKIRALGVSCHSLEALKAAAQEDWVDSVHTRINPYGAAMDGPPEQVAPVIARLHEAGKGVVGMKLIGEGRFRTSDEMKDNTLKYVLGLKTVDVLLVGCENLNEVDDFAARVRQIPKA